MSNYYSKAIQVLSNEKTDFRALAYEIAKVNPKALASAAKRLELGSGWQEQCSKLMKSGSLIEAIKVCRASTGMTIIDAKKAVEGLV